MSLLRGNGINLYYETAMPAAGKGEKLLFIGGTGGDLRTRPNVFDSPLAARAGHDTWERLPALRMPVLLAGGRFDGIAPVDNLTALADQIPGSTLQFFQGGHLFLIQDAAAYPYVIQWLKS
ncbi:MAG: hypothetical protein R3E82_01760 [Pseudomonadales bacterium]|nr:hypothetical protein [Pseudomonadales bacterium]